MASTTASEVSKKEKKDKKDKKDKKKSKKAKSDPETTTEAAAAEESQPESPAKDESKSRKRKRTALPEDGELEVDITAPEPLSKREQRLAKKGKLDPNTKAPKAKPPSSTEPESDEEDNEEGEGGADAAGGSKKKKVKKETSPYGIWIGNLPWSATKDTLRQFFVEKAGLSDSQITRVHMPAPDKAAAANMRFKPHNKGFAYVDFDSERAVEAAIDISETLMSGRAVLVKNASNFEGRPKQQKDGEGGEGEFKKFSKTAAVQAGGGKEPNRKVFVGNLGFDTTKDELIAHYTKCGEVVDVHMATFEDTGKCKGYAWVTFEELDAAAAAVAGYTMIPAEDDSDDEAEDGAEAPADSKKKKKKPRKWFVNRLGGRQLRVEYAEDAATRYKKRFGKEGQANGDGDTGAGFGEEGAGGQHRKLRAKREPRKVDARTIKPGAALANAPRMTGAIVEGTGKKTTFD